MDVFTGLTILSVKAGSGQPVVSGPDSYKPPKGFAQLFVPTEYSLQEHLSSASLVGKELWHIVAPAEFPISAITGATLLREISGSSTGTRVDETGPIATVKNVKYRFLEDPTPSDSQRAYTPKPGAPAFSRVRTRIAKTIRIQQTSRNTTTSQDAESPDAETTQPKRGRPAPVQPQGLKMRYFPFGVASVDHLSRSKPSTRPVLPDHLPESTQPEKRKSADLEDDAEEAASPKKNKHKRQKSHHHQLPTRETGHAEPNEDPSQPANQKIKDARSKASTSAVDDAADPSSSAPAATEEETPEERARRRAEKKRRKEEKLARKAARQAREEAGATGGAAGATSVST